MKPAWNRKRKKKRTRTDSSAKIIIYLLENVLLSMRILLSDIMITFIVLFREFYFFIA